MRKIKFRAYIKTDYNEELVGKMMPVSSIHLKTKKVIIGYSLSKTNYGNRSISFENIELMQYTGLKDKNGKEIYEGDIIEFSYDVFTGNFDTLVGQGEVVFTDGAFYIEVLKKDECFLLYAVNINEIEVIGNIYENKNL